MGDHDQDYRSEYPYAPYYPPKPKKKHTGLVWLLVFLALLTGAASWAVNVMGVRINLAEEGIDIAVGEASRQETPAQMTQPAEEPQIMEPPVVETVPETTPVETPWFFSFAFVNTKQTGDF